jgi:hypothetical protein
VNDIDQDEKTDGPQLGPPPDYPPGELPIGDPFDGKATIPMLMSEFVGYISNVCRLAQQAIIKPPEGKFFAVVVPPVGKAICHTHDTLDDLVAELQAYHGHDTQVFGFGGQRFKTSRGGNVLFTPWGNRLLSVQDPAAEAEDDDGFMGDMPQLIQPQSLVSETDEIDFDENSEGEGEDEG